jgi:hypothetical protein
MLWGRAIKDAEPTQPSVYIGANVIENNTSRCMYRMVAGKDAERTIRNFSSIWTHGFGWMALRSIHDGYAVQFMTRSWQRCVGFMKRWRGTDGILYGDYCDAKQSGPSDTPYTDQEIEQRVGVARLGE